MLWKLQLTRRLLSSRWLSTVRRSFKNGPGGGQDASTSTEITSRDLDTDKLFWNLFSQFCVCWHSKLCFVLVWLPSLPLKSWIKQVKRLTQHVSFSVQNLPQHAIKPRSEMSLVDWSLIEGLKFKAIARLRPMSVTFFQCQKERKRKRCN